jgi:predicted anti-sigma-YlaC factor YlaD
MQCEEVREVLLTDYFDGIATPETMQKVDSHIAVCAECRTLRATATTALRQTLMQEPVPVPVDRMWERIEQRLAAQTPVLTHRRRPITRRAMLWSMAATAAVMLAVAGTFRHNTLVAVRDAGELAAATYVQPYEEAASAETGTAGLGTAMEDLLLNEEA